MLLWATLETTVLTRLVTQSLPDDIKNLPSGQLDLVINDIRNLAVGNISQSQSDPIRMNAATTYRGALMFSRWLRPVVVIVAALLGLYFALKQIYPARRARVFVESAIM